MAVVCCAFELLRLDNYLLQPTVDNVRVLAALAANLRVQDNPAASWSLLGTGVATRWAYDDNTNFHLRNGYSRRAVYRSTLPTTID